MKELIRERKKRFAASISIGKYPISSIIKILYLQKIIIY